MAVSWVSFDLVSGRRGPRVEVAKLGKVQCIISETCTVALNLIVWDDNGPIAGWKPATEPGLTMLVAIDETDDGDEVILWGGMVIRRPKTAGTAQVSVVTLEHYFSRRFTGDFERINTDTSTIAADVAALANVDGIGLTIAAIPTGKQLSCRYFDYQDVTIESVLESLAGLDGGIEFTIELSWADADHTLLTKTLRISPRLGSAPMNTTQWSLPGCLTDIEHVEDYGPENGANDTTAVSTGEGDERPSSRAVDQQLIDSAGWPRYERRFTPAASITDTATLDSHSAKDLRRTRLGLTQLSIVASLDAEDLPRLGSDWWLGDDITATFSCLTFPEVLTVNGVREPGYTGRLRVVGYDIDLDARTLTPMTREVTTDGGA